MSINLAKFAASVFVFVASLFFTSSVLAQSACGDFVLVEDFEGEVYEERSPIEDCANPFGADTPAPFTPTLEIDGEILSEGSIIQIPEQKLTTIGATIPPDSNFDSEYLHLYKKQDVDLLYIFDDPINQLHQRALEPGEYTAVFQRSPVSTDVSSRPSLPKMILQWFIPTAYAYVYFNPDSVEVVTISFRVEYEPEVTGASSILFLPGIMGSRLYEESDVCNDGEVIEQERWFSTDECDQLRLKTDFTGQSLHTLYTKPEENSVIDDIFVISPLYEDFLERLAAEKNNSTIADYRAVPYDWRLSLSDILKTKKVSEKIVFDSSASYQQSYIYQSLQELISTSNSGEVTIVAHSNGGLLAKAFLLEMQAHNDPLLNKIDNLILVAVPQTGTPSAIEGLLQGSEIMEGIVIDNVTSRDILNTAPFGHHLLPSDQYFAGSGASVQTPVLQFQPGSITGIWLDEYGEGITNINALHQFLSKDSGRYDPDRTDLSQPEAVDNFLLDYAATTHSGQVSFVPPPTMNVSQVAGVGISTTVSLQYFTDKECINRSIFSFFLCTEYRDKLGYSVRMAPEGDGTVVVPSALAMSESAGVERVWVDLERYNVTNSNKFHRNILEVTDVQDFILNTVEATTSRPYTYLEEEEISPQTGSRLVFQLHSPLDMWVSSDEGVVSSTTNTVSGALYRKVGEVQYLEVPTAVNGMELHLVGQKTGSFTLEMEQWRDSVLEDRVDYVAVPTATGTKVTAKIPDDITQLHLELDQEGDGVIEGEMTAEGEFVSAEVSYEQLISAVTSLQLNRTRKQVLLTVIRSAEYYGTRAPIKRWHLVLEDGLLMSAENLVRLYVKKNYVSSSESEMLLVMIEALKNKQ